MPKYFLLMVLAALSASAQNATDILRNETIVKMVQAGVPAATIIKTIAAADKVDFHFGQPDLQMLQYYKVPDDVIKVMAAKDKGRPIPPANTSAPPVQPSVPTQQSVRAEPQRTAPRTETESGLTNESLVKLVKAGMGEEVILGMVNNQPGQYSVTPDSLIALKQAGVSDRIIVAIVNRNAKTVPVIAGAGQQISAGTPQLPLTPVVNSAVEQTANSAQVARIFITDSNSWEVSGGFAGASNRNGGAVSGSFAGGARPQTVEVIKTFNERCPGVTVTMDKTQAKYIVLLDHEGGKGYVRRDNKMAVFRAGGDLLFSDSTRSLGNAVKDACAAIFR